MPENEDEVLDNVEHELDTEALELLDPQLIEALQDFGNEEIFVEFDGSRRGDSDRLSIIREWFSKGSDYRAKTKIDKEAVFGLVRLRNLDKQFPDHDLSNTQEMIDSVLDDYERYRLSVGAFSRLQEQDVLTAMFGDSGDVSAEEVTDSLAQMLSNPPDKESDD